MDSTLGCRVAPALLKVRLGMHGLVSRWMGGYRCQDLSRAQLSLGKG